MKLSIIKNNLITLSWFRRNLIIPLRSRILFVLNIILNVCVGEHRGLRDVSSQCPAPLLLQIGRPVHTAEGPHLESLGFSPSAFYQLPLCLWGPRPSSWTPRGPHPVPRGKHSLKLSLPGRSDYVKSRTSALVAPSQQHGLPSSWASLSLMNLKLQWPQGYTCLSAVRLLEQTHGWGGLLGTDIYFSRFWKPKRKAPAYSRFGQGPLPGS